MNRRIAITESFGFDDIKNFFAEARAPYVWIVAQKITVHGHGEVDNYFTLALTNWKQPDSFCRAFLNLGQAKQYAEAKFGKGFYHIVGLVVEPPPKE